ncbi:WD40-repeat-containing domain protein [Phlebopus sp. FC_14]|nr:WD40-repeat-containing domain protein [Phlebopus sp. FC_14]
MVSVNAGASTVSDDTPFLWDLSLAGEKLGLSLEPHDKPRRILRERSSAHVVVTMHGFIDTLDTGSLRRHRNLRCPLLPSQEFVDDACMLEIQDVSTVIVAHARENHQLTLLALRDGHNLQACPLDRPWNTAKRGGVSALTTLMQPLQFASGGYDHKVHLWHIEDDCSGASPVELAIRHTSVVHSLLPLLDTSHKLVSAGADCNVRLWDMSSERVTHSFKTSSIPYNVHRTDSPFCTLLEVAHRDLQFEIHDHRMVPKLPTQRFGFYTEDIHGRYMKGDTWSHYFVSGNRHGELRLWDLRNVTSQPAHSRCFDDQVIQVMRTGDHILACSRRNEFVLLNLHSV